MVHDPAQRAAAAPDDRRLVRPYAPVAAPGPLSPPLSPFAPVPADLTDPESAAGPWAAPGPAWRESGPSTFPGEAGPHTARTAAGSAAVRGGGPPVPAAAEGRGGSRLKVAVLALLALAAVGALASLLLGPDPAPPKASEPLRLPVPVLPAHSRGPDPDESASVPASPSRTPSLAPSSSPRPDASAAQDPGLPTVPPGPSATRPTPRATAAGDGTLRPGDRGPEVRALQERLREQGFTYVNTTGVYDGNTRRGVAQLQDDRDITGDPRGVYGPATRAAFG
ncbi:peptidoglycan-binding protein [Streptomyces sp. NPDC058662]|uniref:peptidoglycan-binding protein n=1 Tax=Streptomyces sp. NPDC058662 TaxID=3346583 RepID=UPI00364A0DEA